MKPESSAENSAQYTGNEQGGWLGGKFLSVDQAAWLIQDGAAIGVGGFVGIGHPEALSAAVERRFLQTGEPRNLTLMYGAGQGDRQTRGLNHFGHEGLVQRIIGGHWGLAPKLCQLVLDGKIEGYNFPQGVIVHLFRDIAAGKPGTVTHVGLHTFVDPRLEGGRVNPASTPEELVQLIELNGKEHLFYPRIQLDVGFIRGTTADPGGNISMEREAVYGEMLSVAQAVHNCGGTVIAQVERTIPTPLPTRQIRIPGILVDVVAVADPAEHWQTFSEDFNAAYISETHGEAPEFPPHALDERKVIARRAAMELRRGDIVNLGIGLPESVAAVAAEENIIEDLVMTVESGAIGGTPAGGLSFGASSMPTALIDSPYMFDFYDGGGLDIACLGAAQIDAAGNVNVSRFGSVVPGAGGFVNISHNAKRIVFCGTFTAGGLDIAIQDGKLRVMREGAHPKLVQAVEQVTFNGAYARSLGRAVMYVTERAVFTLTDDGLTLTEIAPGVDLERDLLAHMAFRPHIAPDLCVMDASLFHTEAMGLGRRIT